MAEGIGCDSCDYWYHYQCKNLSSKIGDDELKGSDYICNLCNDDMLYENRNIVEAAGNEENTMDIQNASNQSVTTHMEDDNEAECISKNEGNNTKQEERQCNLIDLEKEKENKDGSNEETYVKQIISPHSFQAQKTKSTNPKRNCKGGPAK